MNRIRLAAILVLLNSITLGQNTTNLSTQDFIKSVSLHLDSLSLNNDFSGSVLIAKDGRTVFRKAFGYANRSDGIKNTTATRFNLASMGKMFTSVSIMQLIQAGKIGLHERVGKYLPDFPNKSIADSVTISQLLTHTSGMGSFWDGYFNSAHDKFRNLVDYLPLFQNQKLLFTPGHRFEYSNAGYVVLGLIIEAVTKKSYFDYVMDSVYKPCGMINTDAYELDQAIPHLAIGYEISKEQPHVWKNNSYLNVLKGCSAGGGYSTVDDLLGFSNALTAGLLLSKENLELAVSKTPFADYGFGFEAWNINSHAIYGHTGGFPGINNELRIYKDLGYTIILLTNGDHINYWDLSLFIQHKLVGPNKLTTDFEFTKAIVLKAILHGYAAGYDVKSNNTDSSTFMEYVAESFGTVLLHRGKLRQAIDVFRLDTTFSPNSPFAYTILGNAYKLAGNKPAAIACYKRHIDHNPGDLDAIDKLKKYTASDANR